MNVTPALSDADYERFRLHIRETCGLEFGAPRRPDLELAVATATAELGLPDPGALFTVLALDRSQVAFDCLVAQMTVCETYFFRNRPQFDALEQLVLPELIARRRSARRLRLWSAGCATGEEAYSLAILLRRLLPDLAAWDVLILATDINRAALERAQRGVYGAWSFRDVPSSLQEAHFCRQGSQLAISQQVRSQVTFAQLNLAEDRYPSMLNNTQQMDLILFRNVLIYFHPETVHSVVERLHRSLTEDGWLAVGHAEPSQAIFGQFAARNFPGTVLYQKHARLEDNRPPNTSPDPVSARCNRAGIRGGGDGIGARRPNLTSDDLGAARGAGRQTAGSRPQRGAARLISPAAQENTLYVNGADTALLLAEAKEAADRAQLGTAQRLVEETLRSAPLMAPAHYLLGLILEETGQTEAALAALRRCVYVDPRHVLGHLGLSRLYAAGGQQCRARIHHANVLRLLAGCQPGEPIPGGDGLTAGRLLGDLATRSEFDAPGR